MAYFEFHQSLSTHPKFIALKALLPDVDHYKLIGHICTLWAWAIDIADPDGKLPSSCTASVLATAAGWPTEDSERFLESLITCGKPGFVERKRGRLVLHDWYDYAGKLAEKRQQNRLRMRDARATHKRERAPHVQGLEERRGEEREEPKQEEPRGDETRANGAHPATGSRSDLWDFALSLYRTNVGELTPADRDRLKGYFDKLDPAWVQAAINETARADRPGFGYLSSILEACVKESRPPSSLRKRGGLFGRLARQGGQT